MYLHWPSCTSLYFCPYLFNKYVRWAPCVPGTKDPSFHSQQESTSAKLSILRISSLCHRKQGLLQVHYLNRVEENKNCLTLFFRYFSQPSCPSLITQRAVPFARKAGTCISRNHRKTSSPLPLYTLKNHLRYALSTVIFIKLGYSVLKNKKNDIWRHFYKVSPKY